MRILIIDDEILVRVGLKSCINWENYGFQVVGEADNGKQGLQLCKQLNPDIILCDIKMPVMNGIEFIRHAKEQYPHIRIIVLSGYNDYEYVREAMKLGAMDYILKLSLDPQEMLDILLKIKKERVSEVFNAENEAEIKNDRYLPIKLVDVFGSIISGEHINQNKSDFLKEVCPFLMSHPYRVLCIKLDEYQYILKNSDIRKEDEFNLSICNILKQVLKTFCECEVVNIGQGAFIAVIDENNLSAEKTDEMVKALNESLQMYINASLSVGVSKVCSSFGELREGYRQAYKALMYRFYLGKKSVSYCDAIGWELDHATVLFRLEIEKGLYNALELLDRNAVCALIDNFFYEIKICGKAAPIKIKDAMKEMVFTFNRMAKCFDTDVYELLRTSAQEVENAIRKLEFLDSCRDWICAFAKEFFNRIEQDKRFSIRKDVYKVKEYILCHYGEEISLESAAEFIGMNKNYLSTLFSKETGTNFIEYLTGIRVEKAKELLRQSDTKVLDIAQRVGYSDEHYFSKVFKKVTGNSPAEYRKLFYKR